MEECRVNVTEAVEALISVDGSLKEYEEAIHARFEAYVSVLSILDSEGIDVVATSYQARGIVPLERTGGVQVCEWAPNATHMCLVGDFNDWRTWEYTCERDPYGTFRLRDEKLQIPHKSRVKLCMLTKGKDEIYRLPTYARYEVQEQSYEYVSRFWNPSEEEDYEFAHPHPEAPEDLRIYEVHVGIAGPEPKIHTYREFADNILPRVERLGYNTVQVMAVQEHPYYASFGYHVTGLFAPSSRFGTPADLKYLVDKAHGMGIRVLLDIIHSHAARNVNDGLNQFDGSDHHYFHSPPRGDHTLWDSRLYNYANFETIRFLLSNLVYWVEEFGFDGFRFDGITSMLYKHHGMSFAFTSYADYFSDQLDMDAVVYLMLANKYLHSKYDFITTIAEDVSGMPGLCRPVEEGGFGFDYRLAMAIPDMWIKMLKEQKDEDWNMGNVCFSLTNRRYKEKVVAYSESHDQALVGDKTIAFWLMDKEMYEKMSVLSGESPIIDRGIALHKMIRCLTMGLGGEASLTFMGNEFGHPEWLDFPRAGNGNSFHHARRRFDLAEDDLLKYKYLDRWEASMNDLEKQYRWLASEENYVSLKHEEDKIIVFERGSLVWVFNFHPSKSFADYRIGTPKSVEYDIALCSDSLNFGGQDRVKLDTVFYPQAPYHNRASSIQVYAPSRTCLILKERGSK